MDWESIYGTNERYEERLREVAHENFARKVQASARSSRPQWYLSALNWLKGISMAGTMVTKRNGAPSSNLSMKIQDQQS